MKNVFSSPWMAAPSSSSGNLQPRDALSALGRRTGRFVPLPSPAAAAEHPDRAEAERMPSSRLVGTPEDVVPALRNLVDRTGAAEVMVTAVAYDLGARVRSLELLAALW